MEYAIAGALALYVVFFTRPAPYVVTNLLASPVAQVAALAAVIYVGAKQSLLVAVVLALALVMSMPSREHLETKASADKKNADKKDAKKPTKKPAKPAVSAPKPAVPKPTDKKKFDNAFTGEQDATNVEQDKEPAPGANDVATSTDAKGSEKFSLMNAAPF